MPSLGRTVFHKWFRCEVSFYVHTYIYVRISLWTHVIDSRARRVSPRIIEFNHGLVFGGVRRDQQMQNVYVQFYIDIFIYIYICMESMFVPVLRISLLPGQCCALVCSHAFASVLPLLELMSGLDFSL